MIYLQWYLDRPNGQRVADCLEHTIQTTDIWPVARFVCRDEHEATIMWWTILKLWGVNAHTYHCSENYGMIKCAA